jgi:ABC-type dipeptide/oligopeptide/nickel transport system ATPase subunit
MADLNVVDFVFADPLLHSSGLDVSREEIITQLTSVGFTQEMLEMVITSLSGGWKMKLALARAMLMKVSAGTLVSKRIVCDDVCRAALFVSWLVLRALLQMSAS